ncbi:MAG: tetratricopeptide repeat protein [Allosphingosinicella sp.]
MNSKVALKFAVSALAIGTTMVACKPAAEASHVASASSLAPKAEQQSADFAAKAQAAVQKGDTAGALGFAERAVELSPRDSGYRMLLADLYLKSGRFQSAETTYGDVLALDPGNVRASLSVALAQIATGRPAAAIVQLDAIADGAPPADVGLAYALAGEPQRAIALLEPAARAPGATGRVRQNLALAYAIAGDWQKARMIAAQDVSPDQLGARLQQWASFAQPGESATRVAALLGATPAADEGQPVRLALAAPEPATTALAAAEPLPEPAPENVAVTEPALADAAPVPAPQPQAEPQAEPARTLAAELPQWVSESAPAPEAAPAPATEVTAPVYAEAVQALVTPQPSVLASTASAIDTSARPYAAPRPSRAVRAPASGPGRFAVQLGAYSSASSVERAWSEMLRKFGFEDLTPLSTTVSIPGRGTFHRLSVAGFASRDAAARTCSSIRGKGGACFVRTVAGDAPVRWASRYAVRRAG